MEQTSCQKCGALFDRDPNAIWIKKFCSRSCANTRTHSEETKQKIAFSTRASWDTFDADKKLQITKGIAAARAVAHENKRVESIRKLQEDDFDTLSIHFKRQRVLQEQTQKCLHCGFNEWLGKPLILELDHVNGDKHDNRRENLRFLCPNCHSQTDTWRGKNIGRITDH
jgi:RNA polymerase subunit RPABC4/transcription elongation factor Spt4